MNFCSNCGGHVSLRIPDGDNLPRYVCDACHTVHYQNPRMVVGCIPEWEDRILLCRRAIEPRYGLWTVPAGFMENGETTAQGAARETLEEANARVDVGQLYALYNIPHISQVYILFRAKLLNLDFHAGIETLELRLMEESEVPWDQIAFPTVRKTLTHYYADRRNGEFKFHMGTVERLPKETTESVTKDGE
ncbi:MAG TPA: NUDIX hydrolase [Burkholderiales bacterium]|nr:NUDIX hydrolase [Burkholderiales bacterium]